MIPKILTALTSMLFAFSGVALSQVIYEDDIEPIFHTHCVFCHGGTSGVSLGNYEAVMNSVGDLYDDDIVKPGEPDESPLVDKIEPDPQHGSRMPEGGPYLSDEQIELIRQWITEGAHEFPPTGIAGTDEVPERFELLGNYPNPFNPVTSVRFHLPQSAAWGLTVYTATGSYVMEKSGFSGAGEVAVSLNMESFGSGMYIYVVEMRAGRLNQARLTGRMMLLK